MAPRQRASSIGEQRRQAVIRAAYHAIAEKGFEGLRVQEVATQVGIHHSTLYHYFPTKEDLIREVIAYLREELITVSGIDHSTPLGLIRSMFLQVRFRLQETPETFVVLTEPESIDFDHLIKDVEKFLCL